MSFTITPITVNAGLRKMIDPDNTPYYPLKNSSRPEFIAENELVLAVSFIDNASAALVLAADDTFDGGGDIDFIHTLTSGTLTGTLTATNVITSLVAVVASPSSVPTAGNLRIFNAAGNWEIIPYTAYNSGTDTFTIPSHTMIYTYANGDVVKVTDNLMFFFDDDDVDIAGDWADIDRATGKISIRINCGSDSFAEKLADSGLDKVEINIEIRKYASGESVPSTMLLDYAYALATVVDRNGEPGYTSTQYLTQAAGDAIYVKQDLTSYDAVVTPAGADTVFLRQSGVNKRMSLAQIALFSLGTGTEQNCPDDTAIAIILGAVATYRGAKVLFTLDDGTNYIKYEYFVGQDDPTVTDDGGESTIITGTEISGVAISFDISGGNLRLVITLTAVGNAVKCVYKIADLLIIST